MKEEVEEEKEMLRYGDAMIERAPTSETAVSVNQCVQYSVGKVVGLLVVARPHTVSV